MKDFFDGYFACLPIVSVMAIIVMFLVYNALGMVQLDGVLMVVNIILVILLVIMLVSFIRTFFDR